MPPEMSSAIPTSSLDAILSLQLVIAWAGEAAGEPKRLSWWDTDLVDRMGGGDLMLRVCPRTAAWAALEAARAAAMTVDAARRRRSPDADRVRTVFALGAEVDEQLQDRLRALKQAGTPPVEALPFPIQPQGTFDPGRLGIALSAGGSEQFKKIPGLGRQLRGAPPIDPLDATRRLAAALVPWSDSDEYPMPFFQVAGP
jgi:hypothetical protein